MVGLGLGLGASESLIADCRQSISGDRLPVAGTRYRTNNITSDRWCSGDDTRTVAVACDSG